MSVREVEVNGKLDSRWLNYEYTLDGRKANKGEYDPDTGRGTLVGEREKEADQLWHKILEGAWGDGHGGLHTAEGEEIPTYERVVQGRTFVLRKFQLVLKDGTKVALSWSSMTQQEDSP